MTWRREDIDQRVVLAIRVAAEEDVPIRKSDSLVVTLGFDSLRIASLAIAVEDQLDRPILLNDWVGGCSDPAMLTVGSLCDFVWDVVSREG